MVVKIISYSIEFKRQSSMQQCLMQIWRVAECYTRAGNLMYGGLLGDSGPSVSCDILKKDKVELILAISGLTRVGN